MHETAYESMRRAVTLEPKGKVLDVGSYDVNGTYKPLFDGWEYVGLDIAAGPNVDVVSDVPWPLESETFDAAISGSALEHCVDPPSVVREMARVLKPNGLLVIIMPTVWPYHPCPIDCWRIFPDGMRGLFQSNSIEEQEIREEVYMKDPEMHVDLIGIGRKCTSTGTNT